MATDAKGELEPRLGKPTAEVLRDEVKERAQGLKAAGKFDRLPKPSLWPWDKCRDWLQDHAPV